MILLSNKHYYQININKEEEFILSIILTHMQYTTVLQTLDSTIKTYACIQ